MLFLNLWLSENIMLKLALGCKISFQTANKLGEFSGHRIEFFSFFNIYLVSMTISIADFLLRDRLRSLFYELTCSFFYCALFLGITGEFDR